ncbi:MAG: ATP-dependent DNA helicase RecG [Chloroflexi bacterium]|nr:ATP-dependent DNA helicase RecG [Chloroflexota bacterium]
MDPDRRDNEPIWRDALRKILALEEHKGFGDNAVSGGIRRFIERWEPDLREYLDDDTRARQLIDQPYRELPPDQRRAWVAGWQAALDGVAVPQPAPAESMTLADPVVSPTPPPAQSPAAAAPVETPGLFAPEETSPLVRFRRRLQASPTPSANPIDPDQPVSTLRRMDAKTVQRLEQLDVRSIRDLLYTLPRRHDDRSEIASIADLYPGGTFTVEGKLVDIRSGSVGQRRLQLAEGILSDDTGQIELQWFGQGYLARSLKPGDHLVVNGKVDIHRGRLSISSPEYDVITPRQPPLNSGRVTPVYRLTQGMTARNLRSLTWQAVTRSAGQIPETLPDDALQRTGLAALPDAIRDAHYPADSAAADRGRRRLAFDEILAFQLAILGRRRHRERNAVGAPIKYHASTVDGFLNGLPFTPTAAQLRCVAEILEDMGRGSPPMSRLLQGEVGSGKTLVALAAILAAASANRQSALMAPTEVLAEQHFRTVSKLLDGFDQPLQQPNVLSAYLPDLPRPFAFGLLTGSTRVAPRREVLRMASEGHLDLLIGTHAIIQDGVELPNLSLAIADEQHRFGVEQRSALRGAGEEQPHSLMMSATPIPRTLQLTLYGDLDISSIDELPPGRQEILTRVVPEDKRHAAYRFVRQQVEAGRQAFVICPLVEESDKLDVRAAIDEHKRLSDAVFPDLRVGLMHGRLAPREKDRVMRRFRDAELDILVATAVVEVGIDVPNATVMLIDGADRFGLSQLHQFRGRVGRGGHQSYCLLMSESESERAHERLSALASNSDGFKLAEIDLQMRREGDIFGTSQSGDQTILRVANIFDQDLLALARQEAGHIIERDPELEDPRHAGIAAERDRFLSRVESHISD